MAYLIDLAIGDPRWMPHPVRGIGWLATNLEKYLKRGKLEKVAGCLLTVSVVGFVAILSYTLLHQVSIRNHVLGSAISVFLFWSCFATKDLYIESNRVLKALKKSDMVQARRDLSWIVGRDTEDLDEPEIVRATVETIAENVVDGITAPMFYAFIGGVPLALAYKAANTLDSMFGYKNEKYLNFGWASAKLDDALNFIPARLSGPLISLSAFICGLDAGNSWRIFLRDRKKHPSPNSGHAEAAFAGALNVRLGGVNYYNGIRSEKAFLGDPDKELGKEVISDAHRLMFVTSALFLIFLIISVLLAMLLRQISDLWEG